MSLEPPTTGNVKVCDLGSLKLVDNIQKTVCTWIIIDLKNWPEWLDEVKSRVFKDSASNKWCMAISRKGGILFVRFHLCSSRKESPRKAKVKISLISGDETMWQCRKKIVNLDGSEKIISCGSFEYLKLNRFLDDALKLQGQVCYHTAIIEHNRNNRCYQRPWCLTSVGSQGRRNISMEEIATAPIQSTSPSSSLETGTDTVRFLGSVQFYANIQKTVSTWTISDLKNWPQGLGEVKSPIFRDSASNEWCIGISGRTGILNVRFHLISSWSQKSMKAKVKVLLISKNKILWECQERNVNLNGPDKIFPCDGYDYFKQCRYCVELKLQAEVRIRNVTIERYEHNSL